MAFRLLTLSALLTTFAPAAIPGAWETFATQARAEAWTVYDYADEEFYFPEWDEEGELITFTHLGDEPLWFFTGDQPGSEELVGDLLSAGVQAIWCDAYIEDPAEFDVIDCSIFANGPAGETYYYSTAYFSEDFTEGGWWSLRFGFEESWYYLENGEFVEVGVTDAMLASVTEIGFRFFPRTGTTANALAGLDNVLLEPTVVTPELDVSTNAGEFRLAFDFAPANAFTVEKLLLPGATWQEVDGQIDLTGSGSHVFSTPLNQQKEIFRVSSIAWYTPVGSP